MNNELKNKAKKIYGALILITSVLANAALYVIYKCGILNLDSRGSEQK